MSPRPIAYEYREGNALSPKWGIRVKPAGSIAPGPRFSADSSGGSWVRALPVLKHGPRSATLGRVCSDEAVRRRETDSSPRTVRRLRGTEGASFGAKLKRGHPIARDLRVGRTKPLETAVEVRSSADPQIACVTCA